MTSKIALVTGTSSGIGKATATLLLSNGYTVFGSSRSGQPNDDTNIQTVALDVTQPASVTRAVSEVISAAGRIDVLVNNAGFGLGGAAEETSDDEVLSLFETNVFGIMRMTNAVLPQMRKQRSGRIVNISSVLGFIPAPYLAAYSATKHAVEGYTESLDHEIREFGIRSVLVEPIYTATNFERHMLLTKDAIPAYEKGRAAFIASFAKAMTTADQPATIAQAVLAAITSQRPKTRYPAGKTAAQVASLRRIVPARSFDSVIHKRSGLAV